MSIQLNPEQERIRELRKGAKLGGISIKELIEESRV